MSAGAGLDGFLDQALVESASADPIGSIVVNPGGPGSSAVQFAPVIAAGWAVHEKLTRFDIVGLDLRGDV